MGVATFRCTHITQKRAKIARGTTVTICVRMMLVRPNTKGIRSLRYTADFARRLSNWSKRTLAVRIAR